MSGASEALKLDSIKNNCHQLKRCPNSPGYFYGVYEKSRLKVVGIRGNVPCKKWDCEFCRPKNVKKLRARIFNSDMVQDYKVKGFRDKYCQKFLTLTCPGKDFRSKYSPLEAYEMMCKAYHKLIRAVKKNHGEFKYIRVVEPQKDGYPHFHAVVVGPGIAKKKVLQDIRKLWLGKYGMGFVRLNVITNSLEHSIRYITKYMSKNPVSMGKNKRIFTASKGGLAKVAKKNWLEKRFFYGVVKDGADGEIEVIEKEIKIGDGSFDHLIERMTDELIGDVFGTELQKEKINIFPVKKDQKICLIKKNACTAEDGLTKK
jgi:hypothetical protein